MDKCSISNIRNLYRILLDMKKNTISHILLIFLFILVIDFSKNIIFAKMGKTQIGNLQREIVSKSFGRNMPLWQKMVYPSEKIWVAYSDNGRTRSLIDFERGLIICESIIDNKIKNNLFHAKKNISDHFKNLLKEEDYYGKKILNNLLPSQNSRAISEENQNIFISKILLPKISRSSMYRSLNGTTQSEFRVQLPMSRSYRKTLINRFLPSVLKNSKEFNLDPNMVLAIIQTESAFNPRAISSRDAVGLMQIIGNKAGRDAYQSVYGQDWSPDTEYLFNPDNNIKLGCAYFSLLRYKHFKYYSDRTKNKYLAICAYNWGIGNVKRKIAEKYNINHLSNQDVYSLLLNKSPNETHNYLKKVLTRTSKFSSLFLTNEQKKLQIILRVTDLNGKALQGASFALLRPGTLKDKMKITKKDILVLGRTDEKGLFITKNSSVETGSYPVKVVLKGYKSYKGIVKIKEGSSPGKAVLSFKLIKE